MQVKELIVLLCLGSLVQSFTFLYPSISVSTLTINQPAAYSFYAFRNQDDNLNPTPYASQPVPAASKINIVFPAQYSLTATTPACTSLLINDNAVTTFTTSITTNNFTISNAIPSSLAIANVTIVITNVTNPYPAITTDPFVIAIGQDVSSSSTTVTLTPAAFQNCNLTFTPAYVNSTGAMVVYVKPTNYILVSGYIQVEFASNMQWSQDVSTSHTLPLSTAACTVLSGQASSARCEGTAATATVDFTINSMNVTKLTQALSFQINGLFSPPTTTPPDTVSITSYSPQGDQIDTCTSLITGLLPQVLSVSLTPNSNPLYVNAVSSLTFTFTLTDTITKTDYFQIIFPTGTIFNFNNAISAVNLLLFTSGASYNSSNLTLISKQSTASPTKFAGSVCKIIIGSYTAPPSVKTTGNFILQVYNAQNGLKMQGSATVTAQANSYSMNVTASSYFINQNTVFTFVFTSTDFLTNASYIVLTFPADLTINISSHCLSSNFSSSLAATCSQNGSNSIRLDSMTSNGIVAGTYSMGIQSVVNPNRAVSSLSFSASFYYLNDSSYLVATASFTGLIFLPNQLSLNSTIIILSDYHLMATPISCNITFTTKDSINANGYILITIPSDFNIVTGYIPQCTFTSGSLNVAATCTISSQKFNISFGSNSISANQTITIGLSSFGTNPKTTRPTNTFQLYLYSPDSFLVNYLNSSLTISNLIPIDFSFVTITPSNYNNSASVSYTFYFMQSASLDNNSYLIIQPPSSMAISSSTPVCLNINANATIPCSVINATSKLNVSLATIGSSLSLSVSLVNPPSQRPTSNFIMTTFTSDGYIYATDSAISITTTKPSSFQNISYSFSNPYYNQSTNLTFNVVNVAAITSSYTLYNANQFVPSGTNISCSSLTTTISCSISASGIIVTSNSTFPISTDFTIINLFVPMSNITQMSLSSFDATYLMSTYSPVTFQTGCSLPCYTCTSASSPLSCLSCYPNTLFTNNIYYYPNNCYASCPAGTYNANGSTICSTCRDPCAECNSGSSVCTECLANSTSPVLYLINNTCISACPSGTFKSNSTNLTKYTPVCSNCLSPCSTCLTATVCLSCLNASLYYYSNQCIATCPSLVTVANSTTMMCDPCSSICLTCINTTTTCLFCNSSVAPIYYAQNQTCVNACPFPLVVDGSNCSACASPCNTCSITKTNCTSCLNGTYLSMVLNGSCLTKCDKNYFANATTLQCQLCSTISLLNCKNCLDETRCITCDIGFVFFTANSSCLAQTPSGYTNISGIAVVCVSNCSECGSLTYNCTACSGSFNLFTFAGSGYCYASCPNTTLPINNTCTSCTYPCLTCTTTLNNCSSCLTGYLFVNNSLLNCITSCPNITFLDTTTSLCTNCASLCLTCLGSAAHCTSCANSSNYISNSTCVSSCPANSLIDYKTMTCYTCLSPCLSCSISANNCTSCISGYYYLASQNQCLTSCPASVYVADPLGSFTCIACTSNCSTCSLLPSNCTKCGSVYSYFNNTCISTCPLGLYSSSNLCKLCVNNCSTCTSSSICLTCLNSTLLYQSQCLVSCPVSASIVVNSTCTACSNGCFNCSSSDVCYDCPASSALYGGACVTSCPSPLSIYFNTSNNRLNCFSSIEIASQNLQNTLQITAVLPMPFTIISSFLFLCCLMSKIQNIETYVTGVGYGLYGVAEASSLVYLFYIFNIGYFYRDDFSLYNLLIILTLCMIGVLNLMALACVTPFLVSDPQFKNWLKYRRRGTPEKDSANQQSSEDVQTNGGESQNQNVECCSHNCSFAFFTIFSFVTSYKFRLIIFTKLFRFNCLTAHLQNIHGFRAFNVLSFFGIIHEGFACFIAINFLLIFGFSDNKLYLATIDCLIVTLISFLLALLTMQKDEDFFKIHNDFKNGVDLGHRKKNNDVKNYKIDQKRIKGMDSRDKLIDVGYEHTEIEEEEIIVNHNIIGKNNNPNKVGNGWVQVDRHRKRKGKQIPKVKDLQNVFDVGAEYDEDSFVPMTQKDRIELFHTSIIPNKKNIKAQSKVVESRADDWVEVDIDNELLKQESKVAQKSQPNYHYYNNVPEQHPNASAIRKINFQQSAINIDLNNNFKPTPKQPIIIASTANPIIRQTSSQYINSKSNKNASRQDKMQNLPIAEQIEDIIIQPNQVLNQSIEDIRIVDSSANKSYQSILPFVHENGILKQKKSKIKKEQPKRGSNLMIVNLKNENGVKVENQPRPEVKKQKVDVAVVANSDLFEEENPKPMNSIKFISENQVHLLDDILDVSAIHDEPEQHPPPPKIEKVTQSVQVEDLEPKNTNEVHQNQSQRAKTSAQRIVSAASSSIVIPPLPKTKINKKLDLNMQQLSEKIEPQKLQDPPKGQPSNGLLAEIKQVTPEIKQIMHAPKVYKSNKILKMDEGSNELDEFDEQMLKREEELNRIRLEVQRTAQNNRNLDIYSKSHKRNKSKQSLSIMSYIDDVKSRQNISHQPSNILIVKEENPSQLIKEKSNQSQKQDQIEAVFINQLHKSKIEVKSERSREPIEERTVKNANSSSDNRRENISYTPSVLSKRTEQAIGKGPVQDKSESHRNIFDRVPYAESGHRQEIQPAQPNNEQFLGEDNTQQQFEAEQPEDQQPELSNQYAIHVEEARENIQNERQSQPIEYESSQSEKISKTAKHSHQKGQLPREQQISHEDNQQAQQQSLQEQQQQVSKSQASLKRQALDQSEQQKEQQRSKVYPSRFIQIIDPVQEIMPIPYIPKPYIAENTYQNIQNESESPSSDHENVQSKKPSREEEEYLRAPFQAEQADQRYEQTVQQGDHSTSNKRQQGGNLFMVEYAHDNLDPQEHSNKEFTVQNINLNYMEVQHDGNISQSNQLSLQLKKTSKRLLTHRPEVIENQPIELVGGKNYLQSEVPDEDNYTIPGKIRKSRNKLIMEQEQTVPQSHKNDHIIDLLKNVNKKVRSKRSMPKDERDERIAIKIQKSSAEKPKVPHENNNLARKSMEKNKPINQFKFERRNQEYGEDQEQYNANYRASRANNKTNVNLARPTLIDRSSSLRQSNTTARLGPKQTSLAQNNPPKKEQKMQEIREFNFGDEISSDRSKNPVNSQAELVRWKQQFVKEHSYVNMEPQEQSQIPRQPILSGPFEEDEELQVIQERRISRKRSKKSKPKVRRESRDKKGQLQRIYGR